MSKSISTTVGVDVLLRRIHSGAPPEALHQAIRGLQRIGLSKQDIVVHIERLRAVNEAGVDDPAVEDACVDALEIVEGRLRGLPIVWDAAEVARIHLSRCVSLADIDRGLPFATAQNDFLPPRIVDFSPTKQVSRELAGRVHRLLGNFEATLARAELFRVPKSGFTSRPAAFLAPDDRITYEALAVFVADRIDAVLPSQTSWPRGRDEGSQESYQGYARAPRDWESSYVVVADIESFYESISHARLVFALDQEFGAPNSYLLALEGLLAAVMTSDVGLPQGPPASEIFASAFLLQVDRKLVDAGVEFSRYNDDYLIGAQSMADGRRQIEYLEEVLVDAGLRLSPGKTKLMRRSTYLAGLDGESRALTIFRDELRSSAEQMLLESEDPEEVGGYLEAVGVDQESLFALLYHRSKSIEDVIDESREMLAPEAANLFERYMDDVAARVRVGDYDDGAATEQGIGESLIGLASARRAIAPAVVVQLLSTFPKLARYFSLYLAEVANEDRELVKTVVSARLDPPSVTDWVSSWICSVLERRPELIDDNFRNLLVRLIDSPSAGDLVRAVSVRSLAASDKLDKATWEIARKRTSRAVMLELVLTAWADQDHYPISSTDQLLGSGPAQDDSSNEPSA